MNDTSRHCLLLGFSNTLSHTSQLIWRDACAIPMEPYGGTMWVLVRKSIGSLFDGCEKQRLRFLCHSISRCKVCVCQLTAVYRLLAGTLLCPCSTNKNNNTPLPTTMGGHVLDHMRSVSENLFASLQPIFPSISLAVVASSYNL